MAVTAWNVPHRLVRRCSTPEEVQLSSAQLSSHPTSHHHWRNRKTGQKYSREKLGDASDQSYCGWINTRLKTFKLTEIFNHVAESGWKQSKLNVATALLLNFPKQSDSYNYLLLLRCCSLDQLCFNSTAPSVISVIQNYPLGSTTEGRGT